MLKILLASYNYATFWDDYPCFLCSKQEHFCCTVHIKVNLIFLILIQQEQSLACLKVAQLLNKYLSNKKNMQNKENKIENKVIYFIIAGYGVL